ncbi:MAG: glycosyltransferase, partial [Phycisphaerae bacterium]|nr:glycosyltransferase [Phycisphaerae bacterium]
MSEPARTPAPRYVLVSVDHDASHGGIGTYVQHVVPALAAAGWEVHLITRPGPTAPAAAHLHAVRTIDREPGFAERVTRLRTLDRIRPYRYGLWALAVAERLLTLPFEPAVVEFVDSRAEGIVALRSRRVRGAMPRTSMIISAHTPMGVIETMNGDDPTRFGRARYHGWERAALAAADGVITPSRALRDHLTLASPTLVSPHPFPVPPRPDDACDVRGEDVLVAASLQPAKGVEDWARSLN